MGEVGRTRCFDCRYYEGTCKRRAPGIGGDGFSPVWPLVDPCKDWCGDWEASAAHARAQVGEQIPDAWVRAVDRRGWSFDNAVPHCLDITRGDGERFRVLVDRRGEPRVYHLVTEDSTGRTHEIWDETSGAMRRWIQAAILAEESPPAPAPDAPQDP